MTDFRTDVVNVDGLRLRVVIRGGDGGAPPLLLCNGIGANIEVLKPLMEALDGIETIAFDAPGTGRSTTPLLPYRFSGLARLVGGMLDQLGYADADVLGVSWGGGLAQEFALRNPERCRRLVLAATATGALMIPGKPAALIRMINPRRYYQPDYMLEIADRIYGGVFRSRPDYVRRHASLVEPPANIGYLWQMTAMWGWTTLHRLRRLRQPTLILSGDDDPLVPVANARIMRCLIPDARLEILDCGHLFVATQPDKVAALVRGFVERGSSPVKRRGRGTGAWPTA